MLDSLDSEDALLGLLLDSLEADDALLGLLRLLLDSLEAEDWLLLELGLLLELDWLDWLLLEDDRLLDEDRLELLELRLELLEDRLELLELKLEELLDIVEYGASLELDSELSDSPSPKTFISHRSTPQMLPREEPLLNTGDMAALRYCPGCTDSLLVPEPPWMAHISP